MIRTRILAMLLAAATLSSMIVPAAAADTKALAAEQETPLVEESPVPEEEELPAPEISEEPVTEEPGDEEPVTEEPVIEEPTPAPEIEDPEVPEDPEEPEEPEETEIGSFYYINPFYQGLVDASSITYTAAEAPEPDAADVTYYSTAAAAGAYMRPLLVKRSAAVTINYKTTSKSTAADIAQDIVEYAMNHTGTANEGDYLTWNFDVYSCSYTKKTSGSYYYYTLSFNISYLTTAAQETKVASAVSSLSTKLGLSGKTDAQKVFLIYDYLCHQVTYTDTGSAAGYTAYGALVNRSAGCQGFSLAFYRLALSVGLDARIVSSATLKHTWNIVKLGGKWYYLDASADAGEASSIYFLRCLANMAGHTAGDEYNDADFASNYPISDTDYGTISHKWVKTDGKWYYYIDGKKVTGWLQVGGAWYYLSSSGVMQTGWLKLNSKWYYFTASGAAAVGFKKIGSTTYYFDKDGVMQTGWVKVGSYWYYLKSSGAMATGWLQLSSSWYYLKSDGKMSTGWTKVGTKWYYFQSSGVMKTGWLKLSGSWYYLKSGGDMAIGWTKVGTKWYYFQSWGAMKTGWLKIGTKWYYLQSSGVMKTGWLKLGTNWYYLQSTGVMAANTTLTINGVQYTFDANGVWVK